MKKLLFIYGIFLFSAIFYSCTEKAVEANFKDQLKTSIYDYIVEHKDNYSSFLSILEKSGVDKILTAYNPESGGSNAYTLFLPDNKAIDEFIKESGKYNSLSDLLNDKEFVTAYARYHVVCDKIRSNNFPFGALPALTLSEDLLTVSFVMGADSAFYKINNQAPVIKTNIELSNGYIHLISKSLKPITLTSYKWLGENKQYSIFKAAVDATGFNKLLDFNSKDKNATMQSFTLLLENDSIFKKRGINTLNDLIAKISPGRTDYTSTTNPLYNFVGYHVLTEARFLDYYVGKDKSSNYSTYSDVPVYINGTGLNIKINEGKQIYDVFISKGDTTIIDYVSFNYDASNILTLSGAIHFVDQILYQQKPSRAIQNYEFWDEPTINKYRGEVGNYLIENPELLYHVKWSGSELSFIKSGESNTSAWNNDWLYISGDFSISYTIPKIVQGKYTVLLGAHEFNTQNAVVQVYIDGVRIGGLVDLTTGGSSSQPFRQIKLGSIDFVKFDTHTVEVKSLIPGRFLWDYIRFEPL